MFEFLFKYPRSVYARGQFALLGAWPKWVLVLLIVAAGAGLAWLIRSRLAEAEGRHLRSHRHLDFPREILRCIRPG